MPRTHTGIRLSDEAFEWLAGLAVKYRVPRSVVIRVCLAVARKRSSEVEAALKNIGDAQ